MQVNSNMAWSHSSIRADIISDQTNNKKTLYPFNFTMDAEHELTRTHNKIPYEKHGMSGFYCPSERM